jgi:hypothetical protein
MPRDKLPSAFYFQPNSHFLCNPLILLPQGNPLSSDLIPHSQHLAPNHDHAPNCFLQPTEIPDHLLLRGPLEAWTERNSKLISHPFL